METGLKSIAKTRKTISKQKEKFLRISALMKIFNKGSNLWYGLWDVQKKITKATNISLKKHLDFWSKE